VRSLLWQGKAQWVCSWAGSPGPRPGLTAWCHALLLQACKFVPGSELIMMEAAEAVEKLRLTLRILGAFKNYYFEYRSKSMTETPDNPWKFQNNSLFWRLDAFMERCHDMMDMMSTWVQFNKLERVEIGGTKGKVRVRCIACVSEAGCIRHRLARGARCLQGGVCVRVCVRKRVPMRGGCASIVSSCAHEVMTLPQSWS